MNLNNNVYDTLKWIAQYLLPALGTLYFAVASIWSLPYGEQVVGTITAIDTFLGVILGISSSSYNGDGDMVVETKDDKVVYRLELNSDPESLKDKSSITFKVKS